MTFGSVASEFVQIVEQQDECEHATEDRDPEVPSLDHDEAHETHDHAACHRQYGQCHHETDQLASGDRLDREESEHRDDHDPAERGGRTGAGNASRSR